MDKKMLEMLKQDLAKAISLKDTKKIAEITRILDISKEQSKYFEKGLTGYPSIDKVWLKNYSEGAEEKANNIPLDKTVWDVIEEKLIEYYDIPALEYFGKLFTRQEFIDSCYTWARTFRAMGVEENEVVPVYGPFVPDICAMVFGLNMIGACPYFLKLAISPEALEEETRDSKVAVVFDGMWGNVAEEFMKDKFKKVMIATVTADMPSPKKEIVSFISHIQSLKNKSRIPDDKKYVWLDDAKKIADYYTGEVKVPFVKDRSTFITSSSGTSVGGVVKGTVATNESTISQLFMTDASGAQFYPGDRVLNHFPPTASTSLNLLFLGPLYKGETVLVDPRVSDKDFYNQLIQLKPNQALHTGSAWEAFFNRVDKERQQGKKFDFSQAKGWSVGGEGTDVRKMEKWDKIMKESGAPHGMLSGYGSSELFSVSTAEVVGVKPKSKKPIISVGIPYAGMTMGVFDEDGNELSYNQRGELRIKAKSAMKEYYKKPELTKQVKQDGWICTGDLAEIDEDGFVYIWGRAKEHIELPNGDKLYLFDVANKLKENEFIDDAIVLSMPTVDNENSLVAHIVWSENIVEESIKANIDKMNEDMKSYLPEGFKMVAYSVHNGMLPPSPTTLKKDKNRMSKQTKNYIQVEDGNLEDIEFIPNENCIYDIKRTELSSGKHRK